MKRLAIVIGVVLVAAVIGVALLARYVLTGDNVRAAIASQVSAALGQPVSIGGIGASIYPRVTVDLSDVVIGQPARIELPSVHMGTGLRALFSRRIEHADVRVNGARITLPLPDLGAQSTSAPADTGGSLPVEIVSIDEIVLDDVEVVSGDRTLRGDIELVPQGTGVQLRRVELAADETSIEVTGALTSLSPIEGRLEAAAESVDFDRLMAFLTDLTRTATGSPAATDTSADASGAATGVDGRLDVSLKAARVSTGELVLTDLTATGVVRPTTVTFDPMAFGVFGGRYQGTMHLVLEETPHFRWRADVTGIDTAALMTFAGSPDTVTGTLGGTIALEGQGLQMEQALRTARGTARVAITDGTIEGLGLVRTIVTATSGRGGYTASAQAAAQSPESAEAEHFSRLGATWTLDRGVMATKDLSMDSTDVDLDAAGTMRISTMTTEFAGKVRLSEELSKRAGTDLYRYAQEDGRVTLPVTVTGPIEDLAVNVDVANAAMRAIRNRAAEEAKKAIERNLPGGLSGLFGKPKPKD